MKIFDCVIKVSDLINSQIDLRNVTLSDEFYYSSIVFCVIDAIYSINSTYTSTKNVVQRVAMNLSVNQYRNYGSNTIDFKDSVGLNKFLSVIKDRDFNDLALNFYGNRQRTSAVNGILKAQAVYEFICILAGFEVDGLSDVRKIIGNDAFEAKVKNIRGQNSGLSLKYFYMLAGDEQYIKLDRHLINYLSEILGRQISIEEAENILYDVAKILKEKYIDLTPRHLDHAIWKLMSNK